MSTTTIIWGSINANGTIQSGSGNFNVERQSTGNYLIGFDTKFSVEPAVVGDQNNFNSSTQDPRDGVVFPFVTTNTFTALTADSGGKLTDRSFGFIAIGLS
jgi:hypothetical protein